MAIANTHCLALAMLVVLGILILGDHGVVAQCQDKVPDLISQCEKFVVISGPKTPPSPECCTIVKTIDVPCLCELVTPAVEKIISMEKVVYVGQTCGVTVEHGQKCGSYTVPKA